MVISTFAALFLAHVIADYLLQTTWLVINKHRPVALGAHVGIVLVTMPLVTLSLSPWFLLLAGLHLGIDVVKTFVLRGGLAAYIADQALHVGSIALIALIAPGLWDQSPLAGVDWLPQFYLILGVFLFSARGGQYAVSTWFRRPPHEEGRGVYLGWIERTTMPAVVALGAPWVILGVIAAKGAHLTLAWRERQEERRRHLLEGAFISLCWGLACAAGLWLLLPLLP
ncbi:DUF3307 domain-containing protein [Rhodobacterales bacterium HKCCSP123]|nr:DUF3307 domain-containing protein [Rhodobacterales bacterium HKCCSP123]